jgi:hypothetical protein
MMPENGTTGSRKVNNTEANKELTPWLMKRFADRALPLGRRSTIGSPKLSLAPDSTQRHLGDSNNGLARRVIKRAGLALDAWRANHLPLTAALSDFVLRKLALVRTGWQQPLSLPSVQQQRGRQRRASEHVTYAATDWQPAGESGLWSQNQQSTGRSRRSPAGEEGVLANETVKTHLSVMESPLALANTDLFTSQATMGERPGAIDKIPRPGSPATGLSHYMRTHHMPVIVEQMAVPQQREDGNVSELSDGKRNGILNRPIYHSEEPRTVDHTRIECAQEQLAQVRWQRQNADLTQLSSRVLTPISQRVTLQHSPMAAHLHTIGKSLSGYHTSHRPSQYQSEDARAEAQASGVSTKQEPVPFIASLPAVQPSGEIAAQAEHTLPDTTISKRPAMLLSKALHGLQRSLSKPSVVETVSSKLEPPTLQRMPGKPDGEVSTLPLAGAVSLSGDSRAVSYTHTPLPPVAESHASMGQTGITPQPVMKSISRTMTVPSQQLSKAAADVPISAKSEAYGFPQGREYVPASPGYRYAHQPAPVLPAASPARPKAESGTARSEELFRYTSDAMPQISQSGNHNGLELALARANPAPETRTEPQTVAPEHRAEKGEEKQAAPDIRALAREVYPLIKRMIMIERDRHPTWY